ncbi:hypothetical protein F4779DRAFT_611186, partial [Xylariaceae sp. FL0662B]
MSPSQGPDNQQDSIQALSAKFTEWLHETAVIKSAIVNGEATFQLQFKADHYCSSHKYQLISSQLDHQSTSAVKWRNPRFKPTTKITSASGSCFLDSRSSSDVQSALLTEAEGRFEKIVKIRKRGRGFQVLVERMDTEQPT